jgi:hypothetical protein
MSANKIPASSASIAHQGFIVAWGFCVLFYFAQYALRSAPGVMMPELTSTVVFGLGSSGYAETGRLLQGFGSGAAMIPYAVIKEVNPDEVKGSATGAINFLVFTLSALPAPAYGWLLGDLSGGAKLTLGVFQEASAVGMGGIILAIVPAFFLHETGSAGMPAARLMPATGLTA